MRISEAPVEGSGGGWLYLIALGSNQRHHRYGGPRFVLGAAVEALREAGVTVLEVAPVIDSAPLGPSLRRYANGAALVRSSLGPVAMLGVLQGIEAAFGRRRARRWGSRVLDLDIVLWEGGSWRSGGTGRQALTVPHGAYRERGFVLAPAMAIAATWRDPLTGFTPRHLHSRLTARARAPRGTPRNDGADAV
ncbi:2-amino-4-hydroxy-6-hydroxymethyldihydropteridine diphosphokinase [Novosphingobium terrae]|uniref:2-amino-4-hydroxy-6- hydroxymethyldihydropteridine diphosphokinase n=1 Tax=Novosphingobium terrae TaxID=2726189 RepID=UPI001F144BD5|nr:2-amino-4-hydroxy-6-hydroxymethyldihydropteridine diphosphokinase [Novosphingobium terrae]